ncbi:DUF7342 family protein [Haladaptatus sp. NG-WS-4]
MDPDERPNTPPSLADEWTETWEGESTRDRVYITALQLYDPTRVAVIADRADVSKETARDYLQWFTEIGMLTQVNESPDEFVRDEDYFRWRRIHRLRGLPMEELEQRLKKLTAKERRYREQYDAEGPDHVDALDHADYDDVEDIWMELQEWRTVRRRIEELEQARQNHDGATQASA